MSLTADTLTLQTDGQTFTVSAVTPNTPLFTTAALTTAVTFPAVVTADTVWYAAALTTTPGYRGIGLTIQNAAGAPVVVPVISALPAIVQLASANVAYGTGTPFGPVLALSANSATPAINTDLYRVVHITAQTTAITSFTSGLTGTPVDGQTLHISVTGTAAVALTFGASFEASGGVALPTTTVTTARLDMDFVWNTETSKWRCNKSA